MHSTSSTCSLTRIPPELRRYIFLYVVADRPWAKSLLIALRPTQKNTSLYSEAIQVYYDARSCSMSRSNVEFISKPAPYTKKLLRELRLEFSVHHTVSKSRAFSCNFRCRTDALGRINSMKSIPMPIYLSRIRPLPTFETIAAFSNIKVLSLNAAAVSYSLFHQIEGMIAMAVQKCDYLERVEVRSDRAEITWQNALDETECCDSPHCNHAWVERLNRGMRVTAMLMFVDSEGLSWPWFWQAPERQTLVWKGYVGRFGGWYGRWILTTYC